MARSIDKKEIEKIGKVSNQSVLKGTGRGWAEWIRLLEKAGAKHWSHQEIVAFLHKKHKLGPWWNQGVTHGFELATGRRMEGQNQKGEYSIVTTKTFPLSNKKMWQLLESQEG